MMLSYTIRVLYLLVAARFLKKVEVLLFSYLYHLFVGTKMPISTKHIQTC
jgi:hypothetical protein